MSRRLRAGIWLAIFLAVSFPAVGDTELVMIDGRVLEGTDVTREDGMYVLTLESGDKITLPVELVEEVRITGEGEPPAEPEEPGLIETEPDELTDQAIPEGPSGLRRGRRSRSLAGDDMDFPERSAQLAVFGEEAGFQKSIIDPRWQPRNYRDMDPVKNNNFAPSTWPDSVIDPSWQPTSAFGNDGDVLEDSRSTWQKSIIDSNWQPTNGFRN